MEVVLSESDYTLKMWPHKFKAVYTVRCGLVCVLEKKRNASRGYACVCVCVCVCVSLPVTQAVPNAVRTVQSCLPVRLQPASRQPC